MLFAWESWHPVTLVFDSWRMTVKSACRYWSETKAGFRLLIGLITLIKFYSEYTILYYVLWITSETESDSESDSDWIYQCVMSVWLPNINVAYNMNSIMLGVSTILIAQPEPHVYVYMYMYKYTLNTLSSLLQYQACFCFSFCFLDLNFFPRLTFEVFCIRCQ